MKPTTVSEHILYILISTCGATDKETKLTSLKIHHVVLLVHWTRFDPGTYGYKKRLLHVCFEFSLNIQICPMSPFL